MNRSRSPPSRRRSCATGTEEQKAKWLPPILNGEIDFAVAYSEPDAGTDLAALTTRAELDGDEWVVNGQKMWNTGAHTATPQLGRGAHRARRAASTRASR